MNMHRRRSVLSSTADSGITRYLQLYSILSQSLADGEYKSARALPSEPDLVARYRVSRTTVRRALLLLEQEGRILRRRGSGTYAKTSRVHTSLALDVQSLYGETFGREPGTEIVQAAPTRVPASLQAAHPALGDNAFGIQRTRSEHGEPYQLATTYVPDTVARRHGLRRGGNCGAGLTRLARDVRGVVQVTTAVAADAVAAKELKVAIGSPLLRIRAALLNEADEVLAVDESLMRPDRAHLHDRRRRSRAGRRTGRRAGARRQIKSA
jgi:GntR family transcriptional regulator